jgi:drug/metabolite transporter (DMT)-like permease
MSSGREFRAELLLLLAAAIWGFAFVAQRIGMDSVGPFTFSAVRSILGSLSLLPLIALRRKRTAAEALRNGNAGPQRPSLGKRTLYALIAGTVLFGGASLQQVGLVTTTAGNAAFITSLYVVLVPIVGVLMGRKLGARAWLAAVLAVVGLYFISVKGSLSVSSGDLLELAGAFFWTAQIIVIGRLAPKTDPIELSAGQFAVNAFWSLLVALFTEPLPFSQAWSTGIWAAALPILYAGILSSGVAFTLQIVAQRTARPAPAAILMALEGVFGALGGILLLGEPLTARLAGGGALMLTGAVLAQLPARPKP